MLLFMDGCFVGKAYIYCCAVHHWPRLGLVGTLAVRDYVDSTGGLLQWDCCLPLVCSLMLFIPVKICQILTVRLKNEDY